MKTKNLKKSIYGEWKMLLPALALIMGMQIQLQAQLISVRGELQRDSMMIGEQLEFILNVDADASLEFKLPAWKDTLSAELEILELLASDTTLSDGRLQLRSRLLFTAFEPGMHMIPGQELTYTFRGELDTARSMPLFIRVYDPVIDTSEQIKPIKAPINTPLSFAEVLPWAGGGIGAILLGYVIFLLLSRYLQGRSREEKVDARPLEPAHVVAFRELDRLKEEKIWEQGKVKPFYTRLTEITRQYIERQYGIPAMESTTDDIVQAFRRSNTEGELLDEMLRDLLELADLVKFAKEEPLPVDNQTHLNNAYIFVQKTYPLFFKEDISDSREDIPVRTKEKGGEG